MYIVQFILFLQRTEQAYNIFINVLVYHVILNVDFLNGLLQRKLSINTDTCVKMCVEYFGKVQNK